MGAVKGTRRLVRLAIRRDRITVTLTILLLVGMIGGSMPALVEAYPDYVTQLSYVASSAPSIVGRIFQGTVQNVSLGTIVMAELYLNTAVIISIMSIFIVSRHTRQNEESGAGELIGSTVVGRSTPLTAAIYWAVGVNILVGLTMFGVLSSIKELDTTGSALLSASLAMVGIFFAGVSAITVQLSDYKRGANTMAISALGLFFIIRSFGDALGDISADGLTVTAHWLSWLSPIGWGYQVLPYTENRIIPLLLLTLASVLTFVVAYTLMSRRDIGSSIFQTRSGNARAKAVLLRAGGLTRKLQRGGLIAWSTGAVLIGIMIGVVVNDFKSTFEENELFQEFLASGDSNGDIVDTILGAMFPMLAGMLAGFVVSAVSKAQDEEASGRLEYLLGTTLSKTKWLLSHIKFIVFGVVSIIITLGIAGWIGFSISSDGESYFIKLMYTALVSLPAMLVFASVSMFVFSVYGKFVKTFAWSYYAYCILIAQFSVIFKWPTWTTYLSPFTHTPTYPTTGSVDTLPVIILTSIAVLLFAMSVVMFRRRDLNLK